MGFNRNMALKYPNKTWFIFEIYQFGTPLSLMYKYIFAMPLDTCKSGL